MACVREQAALGFLEVEGLRKPSFLQEHSSCHF